MLFHSEKLFFGRKSRRKFIKNMSKICVGQIVRCFDMSNECRREENVFLTEKTNYIMRFFRKDNRDYDCDSQKHSVGMKVLDPHAENTFERDSVLVGATLEILRDLKDKIESISFRLSELEMKFEDRVPSKILTEKSFKQEIVDSGDMADRIISGVKAELKASANPVIASRETLTIVEQKRMQKILGILKDHGRLSSSQLGNIMNLSRTRCNEYFRHMENLNLVESAVVGREKYYTAAG